MTMRSILSLSLLAMAACGSCADWPQFMGPSMDATSPETGILRSWPAEGPEVLWTAPLGKGYAGPAVKDGKVYVLDRVDETEDVLRCLSLQTGDELWSFAYETQGKLGQPGSRTVPAVDDERIYTCGPLGDVYCLDLSTHRPLWKANVWRDFGGGKMPMWCIAQNPLLYGDVVIIAAQTPTTGVVAFDKKTGAVRWASPTLPGRPGYVSPTVVTIDGVDQIVMISAGSTKPGIFGGGRGGGRPAPPNPPLPRVGEARNDQPAEAPVIGVVTGIDPATGATLWSYEGFQCQTPVPNVLPIGDGRLFVTGGYRAGSSMIRVAKGAAGFEVSELWRTEDFGTHIHPPVLHDGHLYGQCSDNTGRDDGLVCMDLEGNVKWKTEHDPYFDKGGMLLVDGLLITTDGIKGILYLIEPTPEGFRPISQARMLGTERCWAPMALVDGKLLIRDQAEMKCLRIGGG